MSLVGKTKAVTPSEIITDLRGANDEVDTQAELLEQAITALESKVGGGGGIDTSDATATSDNIEEGKTAYANGQKIAGTLPIVPDAGAIIGTSASCDMRYIYPDELEHIEEGNYLYLTQYMKKKTIVSEGTSVNTYLPSNELGDATAEDVATGKTFTSTNGLNISGTNPYKKTETDSAVATQASLISQITTALNGKAGSSYVAEEFIWTVPSNLYGLSDPIPHSLGVEPDGFMVRELEFSSGEVDGSHIANYLIYDKSLLYIVPEYTLLFGIGTRNLSNGGYDYITGIYIDVDGTFCTPTNISLGAPYDTNNNPIMLPAGKQYRILVYKR